MSRTLFSRRPDSGLGNIKRGFAAPTRNIDWILMSAVAALTIIGAFAVYSATRMKLMNRGVDPFQTVQRQIVFVLIAIVVMVVVMVFVTMVVFVVAMVNGVNGLQIASSMIVYGQLVTLKVPHIFKLHLITHTGVATLQMVSTK